MWIIYEQIFNAALDMHDFNVAGHCLRALGDQFPDSMRVNVLRGMLAEAKGDADEALDTYDAILKKDPTNIVSGDRGCLLLLLLL